ncbi:MAG: YhbY family RNA-binding protein [Clostridia bacterium]|nr:YhbY family RNA-binding protein [Clostridia bacterium]
MFTSKQRSNLRSLAQTTEPIGQIGKEGLSENMLSGISDALEKRELVKLTVLKNSDEEPSELAKDLAVSLGAEVVCVVGRKVVLYRKSTRNGIKHIEF